MCADRQLPSIKHKLVLLGDQSVGKTSIINRFMYDYFDSAQYQATIGIDFFSKNITVEKAAAVAEASPAGRDGGPQAAHSAPYQYVVKLHIWDTAGQERYRSLIPSYVRNSAAAVVVYDVGNRESFLSAFTWVDEIKQALGLPTSPTPGRSDDDKQQQQQQQQQQQHGGIVIMLVGNKLDLGGDGRREVSTEEAERRAQECGFLFCEVSAKHGTNIKNLFRSVAQALPAPPPNPHEHSNDRASGAAGGQGRFGAATRDPFLVTPSVMAEAESRQQQQQGSGANGSGRSGGDASGGGGGGGCC